MDLNREWWQTVQYAIKEERRTVRLISIMMAMGLIGGALMVIDYRLRCLAP